MFTTTHLRFVCEATTPVRLDGWRAGSNLRGALGNVMQRAYCAGDRRDPEHAAICPVCWLLAANEKPGQERRGYALVPPETSGPESNEPDAYALGQRFEFGLTLFGSALRYLPYFILAMPEIGRLGVGAGRGQFSLKQVWAVDPFSAERDCLLAEGETMVKSPHLKLTDECVTREAETIAQTTQSGKLTVKFSTPMRLVVDGQLLKAPDFGVFFARLLKRLDELNEQFGDGARRPLDEVQSLQALANQVRLMESDTRWVEVWSGSSRRGDRTPIGGLVGRATYSAPAEVWRPLLPWLVWGVATQVGKDTVKGNGVFRIQESEVRSQKLEVRS
jgi:hypothetical protein